MKSRKPSARPLHLLLLLPLLAVPLGCDSGNPVAPTGTVLTITASPSRIDLDGTATILVTARRPDGNPLARDTEIRMSTTLGTIEPIVQTGGDGVARATLRADGRAGTATVTASVADAEATIDIPVGEPPEAVPQVDVIINPDNIPVGTDSFADVTIVVRNPDNTAAGDGIPVTLVTNLGSLDPDQTVTDSSGVARSVLTAGLQSGTATVTAFVGSADPATGNVTIRDAATDISLQPDPTSIPRGDATITLLAFVSNSQGLPLQGQSVTFETDLGSFPGGNVAFTNTNGQAQVTLEVAQGEIPEGVSQFEVRAKTPTGTGQFIQDSRIITIR